jgi:DNA gyrase subunit A
MEMGIVRQINIDAEMQASYLDYAMSVIVARALPDVRDGLKPVHRRILYAMHDLGLQHDKPYKKSARIVGEVLGKYHPHGDAAVYEAMVRMAQDFSLRYPLVDGQGNFGSIDGDNAAAMRYTEARLAPIAAEMLADIQKDTVDWVDNFDGTLKEPSVLPAALPNLIVNGSSGIAVGMSTNIPPHNLGEVCDALCHLIDNHKHIEDVTIEDLMRFIPGPDFPTGGVVYRYAEETNGGQTEQVDVIAHAYASGKGRIVVQAKAHIEEMTRNRSRIVVTELPYQTDKTNLLERIAELVRDGRLEGITDLRDESDRTGMRICIEMTRTVEPRDVLAELFRLTPLQSTFGVSLLALVDGEPRHLSLKRMLQHYIEHRQEVIVRRSRHDLEKARQRAHILEGLLRALDILDEVIALIRRSRTADTARQNLIEQFKFTEVQAQAILDMQLRRLAALERRKLDEEYRETLALIKELEELLASPAKVLALIRRNLVDLKARYGDARRTQIADRTKGALTAKDVLPDQEVWVTLSTDGLLSRVARAGSRHPLLAPGDGLPGWCLPVNTRQDLYILSAKGQATRVPAYQVPDSVGAHYADITGLTRRDRVVALCAFPPSAGEEPAAGYLLLGTAQGKVKRAALADLAGQAHTNPQVIGIDSGDELAWASVSAGGGEILLATAAGQAIRFAEEEVRAMGLPAGGVAGIKLQGKDRVVAGFGIPAGAADADPRTSVALVTAAGFGKRVALSGFPIQGRSGQGVIAAKAAPRTGELAGAALVAPGDLLAGLVSTGSVKAVMVSDLPEASRLAVGRAVLALRSGEQVQAVFGSAGPGLEELVAPAPPEAKLAAKRSRAAVKAKRATEPQAKAERPAVPPAAVKAAATRRPKPAATPETRPTTKAEQGTLSQVMASGLTEHAAQPEAAGEAISVPPVPRQRTRTRRKPPVEAAVPVPPKAKLATGTAVAAARAKPSAKAEGAPSKKVPAKGAAAQLPLVPPAGENKPPVAPKKKPAAARKAAEKTAPETPAAKSGVGPVVANTAAKRVAGAPAAEPRPAAQRGTAPAEHIEAGPAEDVAVKEMKGRSISRADLEKLIRGEIDELPTTFEGSAAGARKAAETAAASAKATAGSSAKVPASSGKTTPKPAAKTSPPAGKPSRQTSTPTGKTPAGAASSKPSSGESTPRSASSKPPSAKTPSGVPAPKQPSGRGATGSASSKQPTSKGSSGAGSPKPVVEPTSSAKPKTAPVGRPEQGASSGPASKTSGGASKGGSGKTGAGRSSSSGSSSNASPASGPATSPSARKTKP